MITRRAATVVALTTVLVGGSTATAASAYAHSAGHRVQHVSLTVTGDGSTASISTDNVRPGALTMFVTDATAGSIGAQVVVAQMHHGYSVKRLVADIAVQVGQSSSPADAAASTRDINKIATALGGADTVANTPFFRSATITLPSDGNYYVINTAAATGPAVVARLEARGAARRSDLPGHSATITLGRGAADVITLRGHLRARGTVKVANHGDGVHLLVLSKIADGVTDAQVQAEYDTLMSGGTPTSDPAGLMSPPSASTGSDAVSPGHSSLLSYDLPAGTYLLQCFVADDVTGIPHAFMGMHLVVHVG